MIHFEKKIQIFISSACGDEPEKQKYNYVREALKRLIEIAGFANVYLFESEGAATSPAGKHYINALIDSDIVIFLIDNEDGVPLGVQTEIDVATKYNIKSLYYFCDQFSKDETPLQKSLKGAKYAKSKTIHNFKDIIHDGAQDVMNDLIWIYKNYCKGRLVWYEEPSIDQISNITELELSPNLDEVTHKNIIRNIDLCVEYFTKLFLGNLEFEVKNSGLMDELAVAFLPVLFEEKKVSNESLENLLAEIKKHQSLSHYSVTELRYYAMIEYFNGNMQTCINKLEEALKLAKSNNLPEWLIKDLLIDLRNQELILHESQNIIIRKSKYQSEIDQSSSFLYYPLIDRLDSNYYEMLVKQDIKYQSERPGTIYFGNSLGELIRTLTGIYVLAMYNGSLTHLILLYKRINNIAFYYSARYTDRNIKKLLLKTMIISGNHKETDGAVQYVGDLLSILNEADAKEIYLFSNNKPIEYQQFLSKLDAFRVLSYYMDDDTFVKAWSELYKMIYEWIQNDKASIKVGNSIFATLEESYLRIPQEQLIQIINDCIHTKKYFHKNIFSIIKNCIELDKVEPDSALKLLEAIKDIVKNKEYRDKAYGLKETLFTLRKKYVELTEELDKVVSEEMEAFYTNTYRLETTVEDSPQIPDFLIPFIEQARMDNLEQGRDGRFFGRGHLPLVTIRNIFRYSKLEMSNDIIDSALNVGIDTLLSENQTVDSKIDAINLLIFLLKSRQSTLKRNSFRIGELLSKKSVIEDGKFFMTNLSKANLKVYALLLYESLGENITVELLGTLADIGDDVFSNRIVGSAFNDFLESSDLPIYDVKLEHIILQKSIEWCGKTDLNIRWEAVGILFLLLKNNDNKNVISNQLVKIMDSDNYYIKNKILRNIDQLKDIDNESYTYILQKGLIDTNYVVRKVAQEIQA